MLSITLTKNHVKCRQIKCWVGWSLLAGTGFAMMEAVLLLATAGLHKLNSSLSLNAAS